MNVYLIGCRGVGKSTVAPLAARRMGLRWIDLDREIERRLGRSVQDVFAKDGETAFRDLESQELERASSEVDLLVATGGGAVLRESNRKAMSRGICVWLRADLPTLLRRLAASPARPSLTPLKLEEETQWMLETRVPIYQELADVSIDASDSSPQELSEAIAVRVAAFVANRNEVESKEKGGGGSK